MLSRTARFLLPYLRHGLVSGLLFAFLANVAIDAGVRPWTVIGAAGHQAQDTAPNSPRSPFSVEKARLEHLFTRHNPTQLTRLDESNSPSALPPSITVLSPTGIVCDDFSGRYRPSVPDGRLAHLPDKTGPPLA